MSLAGLGLSLGELAPGVRPSRRDDPGLDDLQSDGDGAPAASAGLGASSIPAGPLDVTLSWQDTAAPLSEEDRAAVALAMVLMAEPLPSGTSRAMPDFAASAPRWEFSPEFLDDFRDASSPGRVVELGRRESATDGRLRPRCADRVGSVRRAIRVDRDARRRRRCIDSQDRERWSGRSLTRSTWI